MLVVCEDLIKEVWSVPEAYREVTGPRLGSGCALEAGPCDQQALISIEVGHRATQLAELLDAGLPGFNLHSQAGRIHTERAAASEDIDTPIRARRALTDTGKPLSSKHFRDEIRHGVSGKPLGDHLADLLKTKRGDIRGVLDVCSPVLCAGASE